MNSFILFLVIALSAFGTIDACKKDPVHCVWNNWVEGECSEPCGDGTQTNTRTKKVKEDHGGKCSGPSKETVACKIKECPIHCEWNDWVIGECSQTCGGGVRTNTRTEKVSANHGGKACPGVSSLEESCNVNECPVDCEWHQWESGPCSATCGGGIQPMFRNIIQEALFGGAECEGEAFAEEECNPEPCPVDCTWGDWELGECSVTCAGGTRVDTRAKATEEMHGGKCDPEGDLRVEVCNTEKCPPIHCEWDKWIPGECSAECGTGTMTNTRTKLVEEANEGTCTGEPTEIVECKLKECPVHCEWNKWQIGECSEPCGGGMRTNTRTEKVSADHGGEECEGATSIEESCNVQECPVDCQWSAWSFGECSVSCGGGTQPMHRTKTEAMFGGADCEGDKDGVQDCNTDACPVCPEEKSSICGVYINIMPNLCDEDHYSWFLDPEGRYSCQKSCGLC